MIKNILLDLHSKILLVISYLSKLYIYFQGIMEIVSYYVNLEIYFDLFGFLEGQIFFELIRLFSLNC